MTGRRLAEAADVAIHANMEDLSRSLVRYLALFVAAGGVAWCLIAIRVPTLTLLAGMLCLLLAAGLAYRLNARRVLPAGWLLSIGSAVAIATLSRVPGLGLGVYFLALPPTIVAFTAGALPGAAVTLCCAAAAAVLTVGAPR